MWFYSVEFLNFTIRDCMFVTTMVEVSTDSTEGLIAPAVTFCAKDPAYT